MGKIKKGPANITDTSFTSKKVAVKAQSLGKSVPTGAANVLESLQPILTGCGHYAVPSRREALSQLSMKISKTASAELVLHMDPILSATLKTICDENDAVRQKSLSFFTDLFAKFADASLAPFFPRFLVFLKLALSHLNTSVRADSLKFLQLAAKSEATFGPALVNELPSLALGMLPLVKQYSEATSSKTIHPFHLNVELLNRWLRARQASIKDWSKTRSTPIVDYSWQPIQSQPLSIVRPREQFQHSGLLMSCAVTAEQSDFICSQLSSYTVSAWIDCIPSTALLRPQTRNDSLNQLLGIYSTLYRFSGESGGCFWEAIHPHIRKHRDLFEKRLK